MGSILPKVCTPIVVERQASKLFRLGFAEMNGWRRSMEDSHVVVMKDTWGFFGVFDGHGGDQCSTWIDKHLTKELEENGTPADDAAMKELMLRLDREFLATGQPSGSTGTFTHVSPLEGKPGYQLRVGNIGDSRVLLGRADGSIVEGPGTDFGLTTDHKPDHPDERARIYRTGGTVEILQGVPRVNGDLALSRAFGDAPHKQTGGPGQEDHPVTVDPELATFTCDPTDFLVLVCDGISEGEFPNPEVIKLIAEKLKADGDKPDPAAAAAAVCKAALHHGSKDNLSCMIVLFGGGELPGPERALMSGPLSCPEHDSFRKAYTAMAKHAGLSLAQAMEQRYDDISSCISSESKSEKADFGDGPPSHLAAGSEERIKWFQDWLDKHKVPEEPDTANMSLPQLLELLEKRPDYLHMAQAQGIISTRRVYVAPAKRLKAAMDECASLQWSKQHAQFCGAMGLVIFDDKSDLTSRVKFSESTFAWLPTRGLIAEDYEELNLRKVSVASVEQLRAAVEEHKALQWNDRLSDVCGQTGVVLVDDEDDGTSKVKFVAPLSVIVWLPTSLLTEVGVEKSPAQDASSSDSADGAEGASTNSSAQDSAKCATKGDEEISEGDSKDDAEPSEKRQRIA